MKIDYQTIALVLGIIGILVAMIMAMVWRINSTEEGPGIWAVSAIVGSCGSFVIWLRPYIGSYATFISNTIYLTIILLYIEGIVRFRNFGEKVKRKPYIIAAVIIFTFLSFINRDNPARRYFFYDLIVASMMITSIFVLVFHTKKMERIVHGITALFSLVLLVAMISRLVVVIQGYYDPNYNIDWIKGFVFLCSMLWSLGWAYGLTMMVNLRTQNRLSDMAAREKQASATKDKFLSIIAHDLRGPMGSMSMIFQGIQNGSMEVSEAVINATAQSSENMYLLLENLLSWARSQRGELVVTHEIISVNKLIQQVIAVHMISAAQKKIKLTANECDPSWHIFADNLMIQTVLNNIINNAIKFTYPEGNIDITVDNVDNYIEIKVKDNGRGMDKSQLDHLFNITKQKLNSVGTNNEHGTGMGLLVAHEFIIANRGTISVKSEKEKGTTSIISMPRASASIPDQKSQIPEDKLKDLRVLLVEDNLLHLKTSEMVLHKMGLSWEKATDGIEAKIIIDREIFDVILMDIDLPGINGIDLTRIIREKTSKNIIIIALTSYSKEELDNLAQNIHFDAYLSKPLNREHLTDVLEKNFSF